MKTSSVTDLKNTLSARLKEVIAGEPVLITDRRKPIAILQPLASDGSEGGLATLYQQGILMPPPKKLDVGAFLKMPRGQCAPSLTQAVIEEREDR